MRLHVVGLPHTQFTDAFSWCAYTTKVRRFAKMMSDHGAEVITYGNGPDAPEGGKYVMVTDETYAPYEIIEFNRDTFGHFNNRAIAAIHSYLERGDIICVIGGLAQQPIADAFPFHPCVEFGVGYEGTFSRYRVFESYTWAHFVSGFYHQDGSEFDTVIPNYFDPDEFWITPGKPYAAFLGRVCERKGVDIAIAACERAGAPLKIAGVVFPECDYVRELSGLVEYVGPLAGPDRSEFLSQASAVLTPSRYIEPFCGVHVEAMFSGVPVICPDWGVFTETVTNGEEGFRCRTLDAYVSAITDGQVSLSPEALRQRAIERYSIEAIGPRYVEYFDRVRP